MFPRLEYIHWIEGRPAAATHDLGTTNQQLGRPLDRLGDRPDRSTGEPLQHQLAAELGVERDQLLVTAGATHANFIAIATALGTAGGEVLVESPGYEPLRATPAGLGASVRRFDRPAADGYPLDLDSVAQALTTDTALVAVTDRHNPSGRATGPNRISTLASNAGDHDARLLVDEVYAPFAGGSARGTAFGGPTAAGTENTAVTGALTKFFGLGDLRIGWLIADRPFMEQAREVAAHVPAVSRTTKQLAGRMLANRDQAVETARERAAENAALLEAFVDDRADLAGEVYGPCPIAFPEHAHHEGDAIVEAAWESGVLVVPGRFFGDPPRFRIAAAHEPAATERSLRAFGRVLDAL
ncbi:MAG: pyridoxal phosphate-dependent aminotransferase [Halobacteriales archaeon]